MKILQKDYEKIFGAMRYKKKKVSKCKTIFFKIFTSNILIKLIIEIRFKYVAINILHFKKSYFKNIKLQGLLVHKQVMW